MNTAKGARWTLLCTAPDKWETYFIQGRLQSAGIAVHIVTEILAELYGIPPGAPSYAKIYVPETDLEAAREVLALEPETDFDEHLRDDPDTDTENDPEAEF